MQTSKLLAKFEQMMKAGNYSRSTIDNYISCARIFLERFKEKDSAKHVSADEILAYLMSYTNYNARKHQHSALKLFYKYVVHQPFKFRFIPYGKAPKSLPKVIDKEAIVTAISRIENTKHRAILALAYCCGLRVSEVVNIKLTDLSGGILLIRQAKGKKDRYVPYSTQVREWLKEYYREHRPKEYLFEGQYGGRYSVRSCQRIQEPDYDAGCFKRSSLAHYIPVMRAWKTVEKNQMKMQKKLVRIEGGMDMFCIFISQLTVNIFQHENGFNHSFNRLSYIRAAGSGFMRYVGQLHFQHIHAAHRFFCAHPFPLSLQNATI